MQGSGLTAARAYGATSAGGARNGGVIFRIAPTGAVSVFAHLPGVDTYAGVIQGSDGNFYGVTNPRVHLS
jgi:uncharacterized repeat protein (TIGR03803 family)